MSYIVSALYHFIDLKSEERCRALVGELRAYMKENDVRGNFRVATEGYNGTISCPSRKSLDGFLDILKSHIRVAKKEAASSSSSSAPSSLSSECIYKESLHKTHVFRKATCKFKSEIVTFGPECDAEVKKTRGRKGQYVDPKDWNDLIERKDVVVVDVRNDYEVDMGTFEGARNPRTETFQNFARFVETELLTKKKETSTRVKSGVETTDAPALVPPRKKEIAMFCTGGIRCEKASSFLLAKGFEKVYHLRGGILQYLRDVPKTKSKWHGECYVFDRRVSVDHDLKRGSYLQCFACRAAVSIAEASTSKHFVEGVSCPKCYESRTKGDIRERKQRHDALMKRKGKDAPPFVPPDPPFPRSGACS